MNNEKFYYIKNDNNFILHNDNKFYLGLIYTNIKPCIYKRKCNAEKKCASLQRIYPKWMINVVEVPKLKF